MKKTWKEDNTLLKLKEAGADFEYRLTPEEKAAMSKPEPKAMEKHGERLWNTDKTPITERIQDQIFYTLENSNWDWKEFLEGAIFNVGDKIESMSYKGAQNYLIEDVGLECGSIDGLDVVSPKKSTNDYIYIGAFDQYGSSVLDAYRDIKKKDKFGLYFNISEGNLNFDEDIIVKDIKGLKGKANLLVKGLPGLDFSKKVYSKYRGTLVELATLASTSKDFYMDISLEEDLYYDGVYTAYINFCVELPLDGKKASPNAEKALGLIINLLHCKADTYTNL